MKGLITSLIFTCVTLSICSQENIVWNKAEFYMPNQTRQSIGDIEIVAGVTMLIGGAYLATQDQFHTQGGHIPCFVFGGAMLIEGARMQLLVGSKRERSITRYFRKKRRRST
jgi:hypothetical protein